MKKLLCSLFALCCTLGMTAQPAGGFGGFQMPQVNLETSQQWKDVNYAGDDLEAHRLDIFLPEKQQDAYKVIVVDKKTQEEQELWFNLSGKPIEY